MLCVFLPGVTGIASIRGETHGWPSKARHRDWTARGSRESPPERGRKHIITGTQSEHQLVTAFQDGDPAAAEAIVDKYWDDIFAYSYRLVRNRSDAEDIAQETFCRVFKRLGSYRPGGMFKTWLMRITTNIYVDQKRSAKAQEVVSSELVDSSVIVRPQAEEMLERQELVQRVWQAVSELNKEFQVVLVLRAVEMLDYAQIGRILGIREGAARWQMYEARRLLCIKLRKVLGKEGTVDE
jgi:RNA polymerase sigma-70 factor (ECF subfamily)